ncbi:hypothetical protein [Pantoea agglomerans]|uniref:hypothetical protein n=1 Tax=Enterobacter agglomerans TaxID=549 RepID=UPI0010C16169|nr:hypothetical protein [Pantoea agglomerans]MBD8146530.1 hypothetical protein [Pantoea agglomerans]MBD8184514.1 hypothetical protein [Pantoea agglomerans]TKK12357.1 hypothetical protein PagCFBP13516_23840 [Pantoea agglomerans]TKK25059.1 hypothetical protein PagCFBP13532_23355 [Pantoea agglomerans]WVL80716.1 hypothetical protein IFT78_003105 [Pantoea agglomerans]
MTAPKLKTNSLISDLTPSVQAGRLLISDIEKQKKLREARVIPERYQGLAIEGMIHFLDGKHRLGTECLERSIEMCPGDGVTWTNYSTILTNKALYAQQEELLERALHRGVASMLELVLVFGAFWGDMDKMSRALEVINKYGVEVTNAQDALGTYNMFLGLDNSVKNDIKNAASILRVIAEEHSIPCARSHIESDGYGEMSFSCEIKVNDASVLTKLNFEIIERMVAHGYEAGKCVAYFESLGEVS